MPRSRTPTGSSRGTCARRSGHCGWTAPQTPRIERLFAEMGEAGYATSTIDHTWDYLNQACR